MRLTRTGTGSRVGTTLLELTITLALMSVVFGATAMVGRSGARLFGSSMSRVELEARARRTLARIQEELLLSDHGSLDAFPESPLWDERLSFEQPQGMSLRDGEIDWRTTLIEFRHEEGEVDDGVDNDGDGLVDEGMVVLVRNWNQADELTVVLCRGVSEFLEGEDPAVDADDDNGNGLIDEAGLCFELIDGSLNVHLTVQGLDPDGFEILRTFQTSIWLRN